MTRTVILGASGFVGGAIRRRLAAAGADVVGLGSTDLDLLALDAPARLAAILRPSDAVVFVSGRVPAKTPGLLVEGCRIAASVVEAVTAVPVAHLVYISSDAVYDDSTEVVGESTPTDPTSTHGAMHAAREVMLRTLSVPLCILRPTLLYGADDPHNGYGPNRFRRLAADGATITLFGGGEEMRDHVLVDDVGVVAERAIVDRHTGVLNVATGTSWSFRGVAELAVEQARSSSTIETTERQNPIVHRHFDTTALLRAWPTLALTQLREGMAVARA